MRKKLIAVFALCGLLLYACGGDTKKEEEKATPETEVSNDLSSNPVYQEGLTLVSGSDCLTCHKLNEKLTGPAYTEVAEKYANAADTTITRLAHTIIKGGSGNWGSIPMTAHSNLSEEDAVKMVKYILLLKK